MSDTYTQDIEDTDDEYEYQGCECELDYNCGCGRYGGFTYLETRYQGQDAEEARAHGRYEDL